MSRQPTFSIVIPAYNAAETIGRTLDSVMAQTESDYEIIIVNDGSTDDTLARIDAYGCDKIVVLTMPNGGVSRARNLGMSKACGQYIALLDADDYWLPRHLETAREFLDSHPELNWYASKSVSASHPPSLPSENPPEATASLTNYFKQGFSFVNSSTVVFRREAVAAENFFPPGIGIGEDLIAWATYAVHNEMLGVSNSALVCYIQREGSAMDAANTRNEQYHLDCDMALLDALAELARKHPSPELHRFFRKMALSRWTASTDRLTRRVYWPPFTRYRGIQGLTLNFFLLLALAFLCAFRLCVFVPLRWLHNHGQK